MNDYIKIGKHYNYWKERKELGERRKQKDDIS